MTGPVTAAAPAWACPRCGEQAPQARAFTTPVVDCSGRLLVVTTAVCACCGARVGLRIAHGGTCLPGAARTGCP